MYLYAHIDDYWLSATQSEEWLQPCGCVNGSGSRGNYF